MVIKTLSGTIRNITDCALILPCGNQDVVRNYTNITDCALILPCGNQEVVRNYTNITDCALILPCGNQDIVRNYTNITDCALILPCGKQDVVQNNTYWGSHIGQRAYMAIQCQYDLEAHLGHILTFLLHPRKFNLCWAGETVRTEN